MKQYDLAVEEFTQAANVSIGLDPEWAARAENNLGSAYRRLGNYERALVSYKRVVAACRKSKLRSADKVFYSGIRNMARLYVQQFGLSEEHPLLGPGTHPVNEYWLTHLLALVGQRPESMATLEMLVLGMNPEREQTLSYRAARAQVCYSVATELTSGSESAVLQQAINWIGHHSELIAEHIGLGDLET